MAHIETVAVIIIAIIVDLDSHVTDRFKLETLNVTCINIIINKGSTHFLQHQFIEH